MSGINALIQRLERFATNEVERRMLGKMRDALHAQAVRGFNEQRNPYGERWAARKDKRGTWPILQKTGAALYGIVSRALTDRVRMTIAPYMKFHQTGTRVMPPRLIFPSPSRGLGSWEGPIMDAATGAVRELMN